MRRRCRRQAGPACFFLALIPQFVDPSLGGVVLQLIILGLVSVVLNTAMAAFVVTLAASLRARVVARPCLPRRLQQGSAAIVGSLGAWLLLSRRSS